MRAVIFILIFTLTTALSAQRHGPYISPELEKEVHNWMEDAEFFNAKWKRIFYKFDSIVVGDFPWDDVLGYCDDYEKKIFISRTVIDDSFLLKFVVYHELGHCILEYNHICDRMSIMNPAMNFYPMSLYEKMWKRLLDDYFDKNRGIACPELKMTHGEMGPFKEKKYHHICPH